MLAKLTGRYRRRADRCLCCGVCHECWQRQCCVSWRRGGYGTASRSSLESTFAAAAAATEDVSIDASAQTCGTATFALTAQPLATAIVATTGASGAASCTATLCRLSDAVAREQC